MKYKTIEKSGGLNVKKLIFKLEKVGFQEWIRDDQTRIFEDESLLFDNPFYRDFMVFSFISFQPVNHLSRQGIRWGRS